MYSRLCILPYDVGSAPSSLLSRSPSTFKLLSPDQLAVNGPTCRQTMNTYTLMKEVWRHGEVYVTQPKHLYAAVDRPAGTQRAHPQAIQGKTEEDARMCFLDHRTHTAVSLQQALQVQQYPTCLRRSISG